MSLRPQAKTSGAFQFFGSLSDNSSVLSSEKTEWDSKFDSSSKRRNILMNSALLGLRRSDRFNTRTCRQSRKCINRITWYCVVSGFVGTSWLACCLLSDFSHVSLPSSNSIGPVGHATNSSRHPGPKCRNTALLSQTCPLAFSTCSYAHSVIRSDADESEGKPASINRWSNSTDRTRFRSDQDSKCCSAATSLLGLV